MKRLLLPLLAALALPTAVYAFWGLSEEEKAICRDRASREKMNLVLNKPITTARKI